MRRNISHRNIPRQIFIVLVCATAMFVTGNYLAKIDSIQSLVDGFNAMVFFTCFFPFGIHLFSLTRKSVKTMFKVLAHLPFF